LSSLSSSAKNAPRGQALALAISGAPAPGAVVLAAALVFPLGGRPIAEERVLALAA
jgi:hypothetical protein